ncbi:hypothetical protein J6590_029505 [Homalodisca vitripennis]|nr:hypothetical protein J6590_029505 [Homalodisca vitripennis]
MQELVTPASLVGGVLVNGGFILPAPRGEFTSKLRAAISQGRLAVNYRPERLQRPREIYFGRGNRNAIGRCLLLPPRVASRLVAGAALRSTQMPGTSTKDSGLLIPN